jgi:hypothetical protein
MTSSEWRLERTRRSLERLERALPRIFPVPVLVHAFGRPLIPPLPRLAVDSYWRAHPLRADRLARALAAKTGAPSGWTWTVSNSRKDGPTFRIPPAPYREAPFKLGPGRCCICGQPVYRLGWHIDLWACGPNRNVEWHAACVCRLAALDCTAHTPSVPKATAVAPPSGQFKQGSIRPDAWMLRRRCPPSIL